MITVVTSFGPAGWREYAWEFVDSFRKYWPTDIKLLTYWEGEKPSDGLEGYDLLSIEPCASFLGRTRHDMVAQGLALDHPTRWPEKWRRGGYNFKFNAYKFARKVFAISHAAQQVKGGRLFWIDADVVTRQTPPKSLFLDVLPSEMCVCVLERDGWYPECGFVGLNLERPETHSWLAFLEDEYATDGYKKYREWHDSFLIGETLSRLNIPTKAIAHKSRGQPFDCSVLGKWMTHRKGARKTEMVAW